MKITTHYHRLVSTRAAIMAIVLGVAFVGVVSTAQAASGDTKAEYDQRVITIYDQGEKRVVLTNSNTIAETLQQAHISLSDADKVEPSRDTKYTAQTYTVNIYRARPIMVVDGMKRQQILSPYSSAGDIARHAGLQPRSEDELTLAPSEDALADGVGTKLIIKRATPVNLVLYGQHTSVYTQKTTVADLLKEKKITLAHDDTLSVSATAPIVQGMTVEVWRNGIQTVTENQPVDFSTEQIKDVDQPAGYHKVQTPGVKGEKTVTFEVMMKNGQEVSRKEIQSVVTKEPQKEVVVVGAKSSFDGDFAAALAKLRACEAGGNYANKRNPSYRGAYQFGYGTWGNYGGYYDPADAPPEVQDQAARNLYVRRGWQPWPHCGAGLPDTFR